MNGLPTELIYVLVFAAIVFQYVMRRFGADAAIAVLRATASVRADVRNQEYLRWQDPARTGRSSSIGSNPCRVPKQGKTGHHWLIRVDLA